jgi:hypothetical protein
MSLLRHIIKSVPLYGGSRILEIIGAKLKIAVVFMDDGGKRIMFKMKWLLLAAFAIIFCFTASSGFCRETVRTPCEIMESSQALESASAKLNGVRYLLLRHANSADREFLSKWLKEHSETEVTFTFEGKEYKGILCRLAHCFGRGLLIYTGDVSPIKRDIIDVLLP